MGKAPPALAIKRHIEEITYNEYVDVDESIRISNSNLNNKGSILIQN